MKTVNLSLAAVAALGLAAPGMAKPTGMPAEDVLRHGQFPAMAGVSFSLHSI